MAVGVPETEKLRSPPESTEPVNPDPDTVVLPKLEYRPVPPVIVAEPLTELEPPSASNGKVIVPLNVPCASVTVNGTVTLPALTLASEPLALKVPVSVPTPFTVSVAGPETDTLVSDEVMEALVTVNVKFSTEAPAATIRIERAIITGRILILQNSLLERFIAHFQIHSASMLMVTFFEQAPG